MSHVLRPRSEELFTIADARAGIPRCIMLLEGAVLNVLYDFHSEARRAKARDMVQSLSTGCRKCGFRESSGVLRKIDALLRVPPEATPAFQRSLADKLVELLGMLKAQAQAKESDK
ncbi:MAG TPA: hypothetical protein VKU80_00830 [Planctomycetota bacterium]|nr:hypothetical protein [Planctomycetota bacterium]